MVVGCVVVQGGVGRSEREGLRAAAVLRASCDSVNICGGAGRDCLPVTIKLCQSLESPAEMAKPAATSRQTDSVVPQRSPRLPAKTEPAHCHVIGHPGCSKKVQLRHAVWLT